MTIPAPFGATSIAVGDRPDDVSPDQRSARPYILIVDDESVVRAFLARCLEGVGYAVKLADGAAEALGYLMSEPAAAVLCDIRMPGQDGLWLAERVHTHWPEIPIVMTTAIDDVQTMRQSRELGAVDYIAKPIKPDQLIEVIRRVTAAHIVTNAVADAPIQPAADEPIQQGEARMPDDAIEAEYTLETPVRCPACGERVATLKAVRLIRARVNFTSTLPRRGRVAACPHCLAIVPVELTNF